MITIGEDILKVLPETRLGILNGMVEVKEVVKLSEDFDQVQKSEIYHDTRTPVILDTRRAYKLLGKEPSRYRPSAEALRRRLKSGKGLYRINNLIDTINLISIKTGYSIGAFDLAKVKGTMSLHIGDQSPYHAIGRGHLNIEYLPCIYDAQGPFGNPSSDSDRTKLTDHTVEMMAVLYDFMKNPAYHKSMKEAAILLEKYCNFIPVNTA